MAEDIDYKNYETVATGDGTYTLFSTQYNQCYHSTKDGALIESLHKHVAPALSFQKSQKKLHILDICFGLGYNTLTTLWYNDKHDQKPLAIYSPELDKEMLQSLRTLEYPKELQAYLPILSKLLEQGFYKDEKIEVELYIGDARSYIKNFDNFFDIVYQDAFSPDENPLLWTQEYFSDIKKSMKKSAVLTTYSIALKIRLALHENRFFIYLFKDAKVRSSTIASLELLADDSHVTLVDVEHKKSFNLDVKSLRD